MEHKQTCQAPGADCARFSNGLFQCLMGIDDCGGNRQGGIADNLWMRREMTCRHVGRERGKGAMGGDVFELG